ncbi:MULTISPECIES: hypothetical protein [Bifidobacterium]|jgi:signal transduction histidine kinase|uniref:hypothetical protein n=1 Tax=Bifidobacterium TaxID=1678 RepID=UPI0023527EF6|nr:hypothetical protein [Bifidobacterium tibiigranuli]MCH3975817.1 hypothetical protein [Bifidobacterium tibiigranuli]MCH4189263.1 hypothetical protein [Bifidobacterium tibiigranuli]MCH4203102.1 hypothetical protein [Bifidobacterium tibiigranuli]MCH4274749.1 hypothetical protein [Bifidobacterium tibiigranuli]MCI1211626.1 hypothetical protein [Bifidobacterium tibiigranuli]
MAGERRQRERKRHEHAEGRQGPESGWWAFRSVRSRPSRETGSAAHGVHSAHGRRSGGASPERMDSIASVILLGILALPLIARLVMMIFGDSWYSLQFTLVMVLYCALLVLMPAKPVPVYVLLCVLNAVGMSHTDVPATLDWGLMNSGFAYRFVGFAVPAAGAVYAMAALAWRRRTATAVICVGVIALAVANRSFPFVSFVRGVLAYTPREAAIVSVLDSESLVPYIVAIAVGYGLRRWQEWEARREKLRRDAALQAERLRLLHSLHDSVAGSLSYAVLQCRNTAYELPQDDSQRAWLIGLEHHLEAILVTLRSEVIEPAKQVLDEERA